uniref:Uncharacterized protein n=1 Tax=Knipowitschia caucasica TaxID=637954 RepID=A0AAV2LLM7_KNICA
MAETGVVFQSRLSGVMEAVFKAATFEITRLVEDIFLVEVKQCREQVCTLKRRLKLAESKRKRREAADNRGCRNCGCANAGQPQVSNEKAVNVQTEISVKQEQDITEEVKYEINSPVASPSPCSQSKQQNSSDIQEQLNVVKMESSEDEPSDGPSSLVIKPEFQSSWETQRAANMSNRPKHKQWCDLVFPKDHS